MATYNLFIFFLIIFATALYKAAASAGSTGTGYEASSETRGYDNTTSICNVTVPSWVEVRNDIWKHGQRPAEDDLDKFFVNRTGCSYKDLTQGEFMSPVAAATDGTLVEWRAAVRAREEVAFYVYWGKTPRYYFRIGYNNNTQTYMYEYSTNEHWDLSTPDLLSPERYERFYISIRAGTLTFGRECDRAPLFTHNATVQRGEEVQVQCHSSSSYGLKLLVDCPANVAGRAGA